MKNLNHNETELIWLLGLFILWALVVAIAIITLFILDEQYYHAGVFFILTCGFLQYIFYKIKPNI